MPSSRGTSGGHWGDGLGVPELIHLLKLIATASLTVFCISLLALMLAPRDPGTLTIYGLVIGVNLLLCLTIWAAIRYLQRNNKQ